MGMLLAMLLVVAMLVPVSAEQQAPTDDFTLTLLHTDDTHANLEPCMATCANANLGGVARRYTAIQQVKAEGGNVLLVDAGDYFQGTLFFNYWQGQEASHFMNALGYQAAAIGNHEFDSGPPALANFIEAANFPVLGANIDASAQVSLTGLIEPYTIIDVAGQSIGIFGLTTEDTSNISSPGPDVIFSDHVAAAEATVATLQAMGVNKIVALTHLGYDVDQPLAAAVSGIDVIVGGHSHTPLGPMPLPVGPYPTVVTSPAGEPVLIVAAWEWGKYLGRLDVTFNTAGVVQSYNGAPIRIDNTIPADPAIAADVAVFAEPILVLQNTVIGVTDVALDGGNPLSRVGETNLGDLICDAMIWKTEGVGTQICITNGGGIRASVATGNMTWGSVLTVLPFGNTVATLGLVGSDVVAALENGVSQYSTTTPSGRFPQVAGMRYSFDPQRPAGHRIISVDVKNGDGSFSPINPNEIYTVTTNDFLRRGGDGYIVFRDNAIDPYDTWDVMADSVVEYIQTPEADGGLNGLVTAAAYPREGQGRITKVTPAVQRSRRYNVSQDTFLNGAQPAANFGGASTMWGGFNNQMRPTVYAAIPICDNVATCIPAYSAVDVAYLYLYMVEGRGFDNWNQSVMAMAANPATTTWDQATATWTSPWTTPGGDIGPAGPTVMAGSSRIGTWLRFDVTASVQAMINGTANNGFVITSNPNVMVEAPDAREDTRYGFATNEYWDASKGGYMRVIFRTFTD